MYEIVSYYPLLNFYQEWIFMGLSSLTLVLILTIVCLASSLEEDKKIKDISKLESQILDLNTKIDSMNTSKEISTQAHYNIYPIQFTPGYTEDKKTLLKRLTKSGVRLSEDLLKYEILGKLEDVIKPGYFYYILSDVSLFTDYYLWWSEKYRSHDIQKAFKEFCQEIVRKNNECRIKKLEDIENDEEECEGFKFFFNRKLEEDITKCGPQTLEQHISSEWRKIMRIEPEDRYDAYYLERYKVLKKKGMCKEDIDRLVLEEWSKIMS